MSLKQFTLCFLLSVVAAEVVVSKFGPYAPKIANNFIDAPYGFEYMPGSTYHYQTNEFITKFDVSENLMVTCSDNKYTDSQSKIQFNKLDLIFIGDSHVAGLGVAPCSSFPFLVQENRFENSTYNLGVPGTGPVYQAARLEELLMQKLINPTFGYLFVGISAENDFADAHLTVVNRREHHRAPFRTYKGYVVPNDGASYWADGALIYRKDIHGTTSATSTEGYQPLLIPNMLRSSIINHRLGVLLQTIGSHQTSTTCSSATIAYSEETLSSSDTPVPTYYSDWDIGIKKFREIAEQNRLKLVLVNLPSKFQYQYLPSRKYLCALPNHNIDRFPAFLEQYAAREEIDLIDGTPTFENSISIGKYPFHAIDSHFNELGHTLVANLIIEYLNAHAPMNSASTLPRDSQEKVNR